WELATGKEVWRLRAGENDVTAVALSPDGTRLAVGAQNGSGRFPDLAPGGWEVPKEVREKEGGKLWEAPGGKGAGADAAAWSLAALPEQTVAELKKRLKPAEARDAARLKKLLADLDSDSFDERQAADAELAKLGGRIEPALRRTLQEKPSAEVRKRV